MKVLLLSTYDLGRQPFGLASPAAWLREAGYEVECVDTTRTRATEESIRGASLVAFFLPMHTATRMAVPLIDRVRSLNPSAHLCAYGLYAPLNATFLRERGVQTIIGPEFEQALVQLADEIFRLKAEGTGLLSAQNRLSAPNRLSSRGFRLQAEDLQTTARSPLPHLAFKQPDRSGLPPLARYATLQVGDDRKTVGYTEASRGCKHRCRHCPIVPVYDGRFRAVSVDVVMADIASQVAGGAQHITFGDPDFFNGPRHAVAVVEALARAHPGLSYDVTIKVEHLRCHHELLPRLRDTGCAFVTTAVESFDDEVLGKLEKGHTYEDFERVVRACEAIGLTLSPTFVAFTPWTTAQSYRAMLMTIDRLGLVPAVAPIQYAIRLLIPEGSRMLELEDVRARVSHFDQRSLTYIWHHADARVDALHRDLEALVGARLNAPRDDMFARVWAVAHQSSDLRIPAREPRAARAAVPYLNEPWYC